MNQPVSVADVSSNTGMLFSDDEADAPWFSTIEHKVETKHQENHTTLYININ